jgi:hypothetical protein
LACLGLLGYGRRGEGFRDGGPRRRAAPLPKQGDAAIVGSVIALAHSLGLG